MSDQPPAEAPHDLPEGAPEQRAWPRWASRATATVRPLGQTTGRSVFAILVNVSEGGALLWTLAQHETGQELAVKLEPEDGGPPLRLEAVVRWAGPARKPGWTALGCAWRQRLSREQLNRLN